MEQTPSPPIMKPKRGMNAGGNLVTEKMRENITGWIFISPAIILTALFGIFPIGFAFYMSLHQWRLSKGRFHCMADGAFDAIGCFENYTEVVGSWYGVLLFVVGALITVGAYWLWAGDKHYFKKPLNQLQFRPLLVRVTLPIVLLMSAFFYVQLGLSSFEDASVALDEPRLSSRLSENAVAAWEASNQTEAAYSVLRACDDDDASVDTILACLNEANSQEQVDGVLQFVTAVLASGVAAWLMFFAHQTGIAKHARDQETRDFVLRLALALVTTGIGLYMLAAGYALMLADGQEEFIRGLTITLYFAFGSVPLQLSLGLVLAYVLYQNIKGKELYRMLFFLPYVTPSVAAAVVFRTVLNPREGLANSVLEWLGLESQPWINGAQPFLNEFFGLNLEGFFAGPSMALVSIILLGVWTYTGYNAVIFLAGLGQIPDDLYEAAEVDGASSWHLFRHITLPLLSPITFYLSVLAFIGTFKAFNTIFVMRTPFAQGTVDTASLIIFDTFKADFQYGLATAQAILLFLVILGLTQVQRTFFERNVFYG